MSSDSSFIRSSETCPCHSSNVLCKSLKRASRRSLWNPCFAKPSDLCSVVAICSIVPKLIRPHRHALWNFQSNGSGDCLVILRSSTRRKAFIDSFHCPKSDANSSRCSSASRSWSKLFTNSQSSAPRSYFRKIRLSCCRTHKRRFVSLSKLHSRHLVCAQCQ